MANLIAAGQNWGGVLKSNKDQVFPCMDSNYDEITWTFEIHKSFGTYGDMITFEKTTIPSYFETRTKTVTYSGDTESNMDLISFKRKEVPAPEPACNAIYEVVFVKSDTET